MKKLICIFTFILFYTGYVSAQDIEVLKKQMEHLEEDTSGVRLLNAIAYAFYNNNENDSSKKYASMALQLSDQLLNSATAKNNSTYNTECKKIKAQAIENIAKALSYEDINKAVDTAQAALKLWNETGDKNGMASAYAVIAQLCNVRSDYVTGLKYFDSSLNFYKAAGDTNNMGYQYYQIALNQRYMGNYGDALENNIKALEIGRAVKDTDLVTLTLLANGFLYMYAKNFPQAYKNQYLALDIFQAGQDSFGIATVYNDLAVTNTRAGNVDTALKYHTAALEIRKQISDYSGIGNSCNYISQILQQQGKYKEALVNNVEAKKYAKLNGSVMYILDAYRDAGAIYMKMNDAENALKNFDTALQISRKINDNSGQAEALENIASIFLSQGKTKEAITLLRQAAVISDVTDFRNLNIIYRKLSLAYAKAGDYRNAYESSIKYKQFSDSVAAREKTEKIAGITQQLEFENKQALLKLSQDKQLAVQQSEIEKQKLVRNITIAGLLVVIVLAIVLFIRFREKRKLNIVLGQTLDNLKSTQSQLIQSEKMANLGELTAGIAHEIQNPLNFVNNFSEVSNELIEELQNEKAKEKDERNDMFEREILNDLKQNLEKINHHGKRADAIVKGMLQHSRTSTGQKELTDINALCDEYLRLSYHGLRAKDKRFNADFKTDFDETIGKIKIVPQDIGRVLLNLINNAFYAVKPPNPLKGEGYKPLVSVSTRKITPLQGMGAKIEISITDNGDGIPQNIIDKIFQPFFTTKPTGSGTGLGLSLAYDIITKGHNGTIKVESKEGEGTTFIINIPVQIN